MWCDASYYFLTLCMPDFFGFDTAYGNLVTADSNNSSAKIVLLILVLKIVRQPYAE